MNDSKKNWESLNAQGVVDFAHWMIDKRGAPPRIDHLPLRHQVLASRVTITTMRYVSRLRISDLVKHINGDIQIYGCPLCPATETEAAEIIEKKRRAESGDSGRGGGGLRMR